MRALEQRPEVGKIIGMARRPFDPAEHGWQRTEYRRGDILDRDSVDALVAEADVVVHLAFIIFGDHDEAHRVNLEGSRNVFEATAASAASRLVYTSSVAAYGFDERDRGWLTEEMPAAGTKGFYYSAHKAELELLLRDSLSGSETDAYVFRPSIVAGADAPTLVGMLTTGNRLSAALAPLRKGLERLPLVRPVLPDTGVPFQLVHHDDVAAAIAAAVARRGRARRLQPRRPGRDHHGRPRPRARLGDGAGPEGGGRGGRRGDRPGPADAGVRGVDQRLPHAGAHGQLEGRARARARRLAPGGRDADRDDRGRPRERAALRRGRRGTDRARPRLGRRG